MGHSEDGEEVPLLNQVTPWLKCFCVVDFDLEYGQSKLTQVSSFNISF